MFKLIFVASLVVYVASIPLAENKTPPKDKHIELSAPDSEHKLHKRHADEFSVNVANSAYAFAEKENADKSKKHFVKRDTEHKVNNGQKEQPKKEQHRVVRETPKDEKPKHIGDELPKEPKQPHANIKRETSEQKPQKHLETPDDKHKLQARSADDKKKTPDNKPKHVNKREAKDSKPDPKDTKKQPQQKSKKP